MKDDNKETSHENEKPRPRKDRVRNDRAGRVDRGPGRGREPRTQSGRGRNDERVLHHRSGDPDPRRDRARGDRAETKDQDPDRAHAIDEESRQNRAVNGATATEGKIGGRRGALLVGDAIGLAHPAHAQQGLGMEPTGRGVQARATRTGEGARGGGRKSKPNLWY